MYWNSPSLWALSGIFWHYIVHFYGQIRLSFCCPETILVHAFNISNIRYHGTLHTIRTCSCANKLLSNFKRWGINIKHLRERIVLLNGVCVCVYIYKYIKMFGDLVGKESTCSRRDTGLILGSGRSPGEGNGNPLQYSCLEKSHGWRSLVEYSSWGYKSRTRLWDQTTNTICNNIYKI